MRDNGQLDVYRSDNFRVHVHNLQDVYPWPTFVLRGLNDDAEPPVIRRSEGLVSYEWDADGVRARQLLDEETGFVYHSSIHRDRDGRGNVHWFFAPRELENGLILPRMHVEWQYRNGEVSRLDVIEIDEVEIVDRLPADAFSISAPAGTHVVDYRDAPANGPRRPRSKMLRSPVTDVAAYLRREDPGPRSIEETVKYGEPAPPIEPFKWLNQDGEAPALDLDGKLVYLGQFDEALGEVGRLVDE